MSKVIALGHSASGRKLSGREWEAPKYKSPEKRDFKRSGSEWPRPQRVGRGSAMGLAMRRRAVISSRTLLRCQAAGVTGSRG